MFHSMKYTNLFWHFHKIAHKNIVCVQHNCLFFAVKAHLFAMHRPGFEYSKMESVNQVLSGAVNSNRVMCI